MLGSRTIKTLAALLVAMTLGTFALMLLDKASPPLRTSFAAMTEPADPLGQAVTQTQVPLLAGKWRNVVVHAAPAYDPQLAQAVHFVIQYDASSDQAQVTATPLWHRQAQGHHVSVPGFDYNANSIGICLIGDFSTRQPPLRQYGALVELCTKLQRTFTSISRDCVYLRSDLERHSNSPGAAFPAEAFRQSLLRASRR